MTANIWQCWCLDPVINIVVMSLIIPWCSILRCRLTAATIFTSVRVEATDISSSTSVKSLNDSLLGCTCQPRTAAPTSSHNTTILTLQWHLHWHYTAGRHDERSETRPHSKIIRKQNKNIMPPVQHRLWRCNKWINKIVKLITVKFNNHHVLKMNQRLWWECVQLVHQRMPNAASTTEKV